MKKKKKLSIGIDANEANVKKRVGSGQYAYQLLVNWAANNHHAFKLYLKSPPISDMPASTNNWEYRLIKPAKAWLKFSLPAYLFFKNPKADVFFSPAHYSPPITKSKLVVTIHDLAYEYFPELFLKTDLYKLKKWTRQSVARATKIIAVSEATKRDIINVYKVEPEKIAVVHNGYDTSIYNSSTTLQKKSLRKYRLPDKYILFVGTIQPRKNAKRLIQAFHLLKKNKKYPGKLVVVGNEGWMAKNTLDAIRKSQYSNDIILTGYVEQKDLPSIYKKADVFVLPSLYEGFGIPVLEAMAVGTPVAVSDNSSLPEVVGNAGSLFDPRDPADIAKSILKAVTDKGKFSEKGLARAKSFSWKRTASQTLRVITSVALENSKN